MIKNLRNKIFKTAVEFAKEHGVEVELTTTVEVRNLMFLGHGNKADRVNVSDTRGYLLEDKGEKFVLWVCPETEELLLSDVPESNGFFINPLKYMKKRKVK